MNFGYNGGKKWKRAQKLRRDAEAARRHAYLLDRDAAYCNAGIPSVKFVCGRDGRVEIRGRCFGVRNGRDAWKYEPIC